MSQFTNLSWTPLLCIAIALASCSASNESAGEIGSQAQRTESQDTSARVDVNRGGQGDRGETGVVSSPPPISFPMPSCGDTLPQEHRAYPMSVSGIYVPFSEKNLEIVKNNFCQDAFARTSRETGDRVVQVASFINGSLGLVPTGERYSLSYNLRIGKIDSKHQSIRAKLMHALQQRFGKNSVVEESVVLVSDSKYLSLDNVNSPQKLSSKAQIKPKPRVLINLPIREDEKIDRNVMKAAKLNTVHIDKLTSIGKVSVLFDESLEFTLGIIVPTYLPDGFFVSDINITKLGDKNKWYTIQYQDDSNRCFSVMGFPVQLTGDGIAFIDRDIKVKTKTLGLFELMYTQFFQSKNSAAIITADPVGISPNGYSAYRFSSPAGKHNELYYR